MTQAAVSPRSPAAEASPPPGTLRAAIEARRARGELYTMREVVSVVIPLCVELGQRHARGEKFVVHPSSILFVTGKPATLAPPDARVPAKLPHDRACLAPEERSGKGGDARSSVFSMGAIVYEMLTGHLVGPGMRRPSELVAGLSEAVEAVLGKALIGDPQHRPADLAALAQALHRFAPTASVAPPAADESHLDRGEDFEVDVSLSMIPPPPPTAGTKLPRPAPLPQDLVPKAAGIVEVAEAPKAPPPIDPTQKLADLKAALEADPRPRFVVIKDGMDHGPFTAVELLQQIASHTFEEQHILVDTFSNDERPMTEWEEFSQFCEQAKLNREIVAEKKEIEKSVVAETKATRSKALLIGASIAGIVVLGVVLFLATKRKERTGEVMTDLDLAINIETDAGIKGATKRGPVAAGGPWAGGGERSGHHPVLRGGMSCEQAMNTYVDEIKMGGGGKPDLTAGAFGAVLNNGSYVIACGAPMSMTVSICAAIQNGQAVGVSVSTDPPNSGIASCIAGRVRGMRYPSAPNLDVTRTVFKGQ
jgi:hypothetical protein